MFAQIPEIENLRMPAARARSRNRPSPTRCQIAVAAELFALNLETWRQEPFVEDNYTSRELDELGTALRKQAEHPGRAEITWAMRQATFERTGS